MTIFEQQLREELKNEALLAVMAACVITGVVAGFITGIQWSQPPEAVLESNRQAGYSTGFQAGLTALPDGEPRFLRRHETGFNYSFAFVYPEQEISYRCEFSRLTKPDGGGEWVISKAPAYLYNGTVACEVVQRNLIPEYDGPLNNTLLRNTVDRGNTTNATAG